MATPTSIVIESPVIPSGAPNIVTPSGAPNTVILSGATSIVILSGAPEARSRRTHSRRTRSCWAVKGNVILSLSKDD